MRAIILEKDGILTVLIPKEKVMVGIQQNGKPVVFDADSVRTAVLAYGANPEDTAVRAVDLDRPDEADPLIAWAKQAEKMPALLAVIFQKKTAEEEEKYSAAVS